MKLVLRRATQIIAEILLAGLGCILIAGIGLYLLIPDTPFQSQTGQRLAESALSNVFEGAPVRFDSLYFNKGTFREPIHIEANGMRVYGLNDESDAKPVLTSKAIKLDLSIFDLLVGKAAISGMEVSNLTLTARRGLDGQFRFALSSGSSPKAAKKTIRPLAVLDKIDTLKIHDAQLVFEDTQAGTSDIMANMNINLTRRVEFAQSLAVITAYENDGDARPILDFVLTTTNGSADAEAIAYIHNLDLERLLPWLPGASSRISAADAIVSGELRLNFAKATGQIETFKIALNAPNGSVQLADTAPKPIVFKDMQLNWTQDGGLLTGAVQDRLLKIAAVENKDKTYELELNVPELAPEDIAALWPEDNKGVAQEWVTEKLGEGVFKDVKFTGIIAQNPETGKWGLNDPRASFATENLRILYKHGLEPVHNVYAHGTYENDTLKLDFQRGEVKGLSVLEGNLEFDHLTAENDGYCKGFLRLRGPLQGVLGYLDNPIIRYKERVSVDLSKAAGDIQMTVALDFPTSKHAKMSDIKVDVDAILHRAALPDIVPGVTISGGPLAVKGDPDHVSIRGDALLNGTSAYLYYQTYFGGENMPFHQRLELKSTLTRETIAGFGAGDWARDVTKPSNAALNYNQPLTGPSTLSLNIEGPDFSVKDADLRLAKNNNFQGGTFKGLVLGRTNGDLSVGRTKDNGYSIDFTGPSFDARPVLSGDSGGQKKSSGKAPTHMSVDIKTPRLITSDNNGVKDAVMKIGTNGKGDVSLFELDGVSGNGPVKVRFSEMPDGDALDVDAQDAGEFLRALNLTEGVHGGVLQIQAVPNGSYGSMKGRARIMNFQARELPVLAGLLNALSLTGLFDLLNNTGISFERLRSDFTYEKGGLIRLSDGRTSGSSLGLTFNGSLNRSNGDLNMSGQIVPLSQINGLVKSIPLLGPLLSGGKDSSLLAANYTMKGSTKDPKVSVNPLSVLTPGLLRNILFQNDPDEPTPAKKATPNP